MSSFKIIGLLVSEKIFEGLYHICAWRPSWSCDLDHLYKFSLPFLMDAPHKIRLLVAKRFRRRSLKMVDDDGRQRIPIA